MSNIIEVKNLVKKYKKSEVHAVDDVSFYVEKGSFFALLGPNGAGKTTTLSILNTTLNMTEGQATIAGFDLESNPEKVRKNIGVIFQNHSLDVKLTAEENIRFHANLYGLYKYKPSYSMMPQAYREKVTQLANVLGLEMEAMLKPVDKLSGGMKRKLEIIRGLMHEPKVLFLDEPTTGLDPLSRKNLWQYLQKIREEEQVTIFLTTHYLDEAEDADYIVILDRGKIVSKGTPKEIKEELIENYLEVDSKERTNLKEELQQKKYSFSGKGPFKIKINGGNTQEMINNIETKLSILKINSPSLEEAYISIIEKEENE